MNDALVSQLFLHDKDILEEINYALIDIEMIELSDHSLLVLKMSFVCVDEGISFVDYASNVVERLYVCDRLKFCQRVIEGLVLSLLSFQLEVHVLDLSVIPFQLTKDHFFVLTIAELSLDLLKVAYDFWEFVRVGLLATRLF